jgi:outer membrane protein assembly factor BamA
MAQQQYYGTTATAVRIAEPGDPNDLQRIPIRPGDTITVENIRASIQALYDTGRYRYIEVDASADAGGTALTFGFQLHYFFSTFRLEPPDLLDRSLSAFFRVPLGEKFSTAQVDRIVVEAKQLLEDQGYFGATITPEFVFETSTKLAHVILKAQT